MHCILIFPWDLFKEKILRSCWANGIATHCCNIPAFIFIYIITFFLSWCHKYLFVNMFVFVWVFVLLVKGWGRWCFIICHGYMFDVRWDEIYDTTLYFLIWLAVNNNNNNGKHKIKNIWDREYVDAERSLILWLWKCDKNNKCDISLLKFIHGNSLWLYLQNY